MACASSRRGRQSRKVEVHLLDYSGNLYGKQLNVDLLERVRDITQFESVEELQEQLSRDIAHIRAVAKQRSGG